jgi:hypothetical protein
VAISRPADNGFVLIGAIWLLVLAGAIASALLLRSLADARHAAAGARSLSAKLALEGAVESAFASLLFHGPRSQLTSGGGTVGIGEMAVQLTLSSEAERIDLNHTAPEFIDGALRELGVNARGRSAILGRMALLRARKDTIASPSEMRRLLGAEAGGFEDAFTIHSGLSVPAGVVGARAVPRGSGALAPAAPLALQPGMAIRIVASLAEGQSLLATGRLTGLGHRPVLKQRWEYVWRERRPKQ